jgi:hypothetical protein
VRSVSEYALDDCAQESATRSSLIPLAMGNLYHGGVLQRWVLFRMSCAHAGTAHRVLLTEWDSTLPGVLNFLPGPLTIFVYLLLF